MANRPKFLALGLVMLLVGCWAPPAQEPKPDLESLRGQIEYLQYYEYGEFLAGVTVLSTEGSATVGKAGGGIVKLDHAYLAAGPHSVAPGAQMSIQEFPLANLPSPFPDYLKPFAAYQVKIERFGSGEGLGEYGEKFVLLVTIQTPAEVLPQAVRASLKEQKPLT